MPLKVPLKIDAFLTLRSEGRLLVGRERIELLEAVIKHGNMAQAARAMGFSYKTAWESVQAINRLLPRPAFIVKSGGRRIGQSATVTEEGLRLIAAFRRVEEEFGRTLTSIAKDGWKDAADRLSWNKKRRLPTRNRFDCRIVEINPVAVNIEVKLEVAPDIFICALVTNRIVADLGLIPGCSVIAIINNMSIMLVSSIMAGRISGRNKIVGNVVSRVDGDDGSEIMLDIGYGKTIEAVIAKNTADEIGAQHGTRVFAVFNVSHVILAVD